MPSRKYPLLNNKQWLVKQYIERKLGTRKICELAGAKTCNSVRQALIRFNIPIRSVSEGLTCNRTSDGFCLTEASRQIIEGSLLGDGYLSKWKKSSETATPYFAKRNINYDHILYVASQIFGDKANSRVKECHEKTSWDQSPYVVFSLRSYTHKELHPLFDAWYPKANNYIKLVPRTLKLTPVSLLHWFLDDGCSWVRRKNSKTKQVVITMCTECFSKDDNEFLASELKVLFGLSTNVRRYEKAWRVHISQSSAQKFFEIIGPPPISSMTYKWK